MLEQAEQHYCPGERRRKLSQYGIFQKETVVFFFCFTAVSYWPSFLCCHKRPHSYQTSHRDSSELPGRHKSPQTATDVEWYRSKAPRGGCSSQTMIFRTRYFEFTQTHRTKKEFTLKLLLQTDYSGNTSEDISEKRDFQKWPGSCMVSETSAKELVAISQNNRSIQTGKAAAVYYGLAQRWLHHVRKHIFTYICWHGVNRDLSR